MEDERVDTGFADIINGAPVWSDPGVTAAVTSGLTEEGKDAAKVLLQIPDFTQQQLAALAREIAMDIKTIDNILRTHNLTNPQYEYLKENNEFFKHALKTLTIEWHSAASTPERIKIEAAAAIEDAMPVLYTRMVNKAEGLPGVTEVAKLFAKIAGVGERQEGAGAPGERFTITIDLGGDQKLVVGTKDVTPALPAPGGASALPALTQGDGDTRPVQPNIEKG